MQQSHVWSGMGILHVKVKKEPQLVLRARAETKARPAPSDGHWRHQARRYNIIRYYLAPGGGCEVLFSPGLSVCLSVCVCVCVVSGQYFGIFFSAIRRDIDLKFIQDTYRVVLNSLKKIDLHRSKVKVTGTVHCLLKVQSYHKN